MHNYIFQKQNKLNNKSGIVSHAQLISRRLASHFCFCIQSVVCYVAPGKLHCILGKQQDI